MHIIRIFFLLVILIVFGSMDKAYADDPPVIINRSTEVHDIGGKKYHLHAVLKGQTLYSIAQAYGVTVDDIEEENPELEYGLRYDQLIKIPYVERPVESDKKEYIEHRVRRRETLFGISQQYEVSQKKILEYNPEARKGLKVNQVLRIPVEPDVEEPSYKTYKVSSGDTFYSLSREFNVSIEKINKLNPELNGVLKAGHTIRLPEYVEKEHLEVDAKIKEPAYFEHEYEEVHKIDLYDKSYCDNPKLKEHYNVALLIPLFLEEVEEYYESGEPLPKNHRARAFLDFYNGVRIALDSVRQMGANITLNVYDVCQDTNKAEEVIQKPEFKNMDFIIGPFFPATMKLVAGFAEKNDISMVSPMLQDRNQLDYYKNLFQFTPSLSTQLNDLADYIAYKYPTQNIILVHNNQPGVAQLISEFNNTLNQKVGEKRYFADSLNLARVNGYYFSESMVGERATNEYVFNDSLFHYFEPPSIRKSYFDRDEVFQKYMHRRNFEEIVLIKDSISGLKQKLIGNSKNILISLFGGEPVVSNYIRSLSLLADTFDITVFGVPQWKDYANLEIDYLQAVDAHIITPDFVKYSDRNVQYFVNTYRKRFLDEPNNNAFKGVEIGFYFMNAIMKYGREFHKCVYELNRFGDHNSIRFKKTVGKESGYENVRTTIFMYDNFRMVNVREPAFIDK